MIKIADDKSGNAYRAALDAMHGVRQQQSDLGKSMRDKRIDAYVAMCEYFPAHHNSYSSMDALNDWFAGTKKPTGDTLTTRKTDFNAFREASILRHRLGKPIDRKFYTDCPNQQSFVMRCKWITNNAKDKRCGDDAWLGTLIVKPNRDKKAEDTANVTAGDWLARAIDALTRLATMDAKAVQRINGSKAPIAEMQAMAKSGKYPTSNGKTEPVDPLTAALAA